MGDAFGLKPDGEWRRHLSIAVPLDSEGVTLRSRRSPIIAGVVHVPMSNPRVRCLN